MIDVQVALFSCVSNMPSHRQNFESVLFVHNHYLFRKTFVKCSEEHVRKLPNRRNYDRKTTPALDMAPLGVEMTVGAEQSFCEILLEAIDEAFSSLGESIGEAMNFHLDKSFGISRREIPFRIDDFSDALEKIFGLGARHLEILIMKNLHAKAKVEYNWDLPKWVVPELTFKEYIRNVKRSFE